MIVDDLLGIMEWEGGSHEIHVSGHYDVAQICLNGHVITKRAVGYPQHRKKLCDKCGAEAIMACPLCKAPIQDEYDVPGVVAFAGSYRAPVIAGIAAGRTNGPRIA